jgi:hypothetical protein
MFPCLICYREAVGRTLNEDFLDVVHIMFVGCIQHALGASN